MAMILFSALALCAVATALPQAQFGFGGVNPLIRTQTVPVVTNNFRRGPLVGGPDASIARTRLAQDQSLLQTIDSRYQTALARLQAKLYGIIKIAEKGLQKAGTITVGAIRGMPSWDSGYNGDGIIGDGFTGIHGDGWNGFRGNRRGGRVDPGIVGSRVVDHGIGSGIHSSPVVTDNDSNTNVNSNNGKAVAIAVADNNQQSDNIGSSPVGTDNDSNGNGNSNNGKVVAIAVLDNNQGATNIDN